MTRKFLAPILIMTFFAFSIMNARTIQAAENQNIHVGMNAKGNLNTSVQVNYLSDYLSTSNQEYLLTQSMYLRIQGGTISQKTFPNDWSDEQLNAWANLQSTYHCSMNFVINMNDSALSQFEFYKRCLSQGITFHMIEIGNEQYLPKYAQNKSGYPEVTERTANMTPQKYIQLCNEYIAAFQDVELPFYIQLAPERDSGNNYTAWNDRIISAINNHEFSTSNLGLTLHMYEREETGSLDVTQISRFRERLSFPMQIAITEFGVTDKSNTKTYEDIINQESNLANRLLSQLLPEDILLNQVLYTDYKTVGNANFHEQYSGITPKGRMIFDLFILIFA